MALPFPPEFRWPGGAFQKPGHGRRTLVRGRDGRPGSCVCDGSRTPAGNL